MTTIVVTRTAIYADTFCTYSIPFKRCKIDRIGKSIYGGCGSSADILKFFAWRRGGDRPEFSDDASFDVIELNKQGMFFWDKDLIVIPIEEKIYAIGSGGAFAMGALAAGADPVKALKIAAKYDPNTRAPFDSMDLKET